MKLFAIKDTKAEILVAVQMAPNYEVFKRNFVSYLTKDNPLVQFPADYSVIECGSIDDNGLISSHLKNLETIKQIFDSFSKKEETEEEHDITKEVL